VASEGYPTSPRIGDPILGLDAVAARPDATAYCAGVAAAADGALVTAGGRVLSITGRGPTLAEARAAAYAAVGDVSWPGAHHRDDIAAAAAGGGGT
jgi:phosphoribosylamine---glycine ligase